MSRLGALGHLVSHLLFADDTLVFFDVDKTQLDYLGQVLTFLVPDGIKP